MRQSTEDTASDLISITMPDDYALNVRIWQAKEPKAVVLILHGVVSHSLWLNPLAANLVEHNITVICPDRRGAGTNQVNRGDAPNENTLLEDVKAVINYCHCATLPLHLCGFCWGSNYAINFLTRFPQHITSLALLAPAIFPAESLRNAELKIGPESDATELPIVPLEGFTQGPAYQNFILPDTLRISHVSPRFNGIMQSLSRMLGIKLLKLPIPTLMVLAKDDKMTDNETTARVFDRLKTSPKRLVYVPGEHGVQFDAPVETSNALLDWIMQF